MPKKSFEDILIVYPSDCDPGKFVAHSVRTDQIGVGDNAVEAICELFSAVRDLLEEAAKDTSIVVECLAPDEVLRKFATAHKIPDAKWLSIQKLV